MERKANLEYLMKKLSELKEEDEKVGVEQTKKENPLVGEGLTNVKVKKDSYHDVTGKNLSKALEEIMGLEEEVEKMTGNKKENKEKEKDENVKKSARKDLITLLVHEEIPNKKYASLYQDIVLLALKDFTNL